MNDNNDDDLSQGITLDELFAKWREDPNFLEEYEKARREMREFIKKNASISQ